MKIPMKLDSLYQNPYENRYSPWKSLWTYKFPTKISMIFDISNENPYEKRYSKSLWTYKFPLKISMKCHISYVNPLEKSLQNPWVATHDPRLGAHPLPRRAGAHGAGLRVVVHEGTVAPVPLGVAGKFDGDFYGDFMGFLGIEWWFHGIFRDWMMIYHHVGGFMVV